MIGKECIAIASDLRLGQQSLGVSNNFEKIFEISPKTYLGLTGLASDVLTLKNYFDLKQIYINYEKIIQLNLQL